jgi:hypothetical protein
MPVWDWVGENIDVRTRFNIWQLAVASIVFGMGQVALWMILVNVARRLLNHDFQKLRWAEESREELYTAVSINRLDDTLLRLLPRMISGSDQLEDLRRVVGEFLRDATEIFTDDVVYRAVVLRVQDGALVPFVGCRMTEETMSTLRFPLSDRNLPDGSPIGTALRSFVDQKN